MCSMPQKHPAARVAFCAPSGTCMAVAAESGAKRRVLEVKGRVRRWKMDVMVGSVMIETMKMRKALKGFRLAVMWCWLVRSRR